MEKLQPFKLALIQAAIDPGEARLNMERLDALIGRAAKQGAEVVLLPEALPFGWMDPSGRQGADSIPDGWISSAFRGMAREYRVHLCAGIVEKDHGSIFNSAVLIDPRGEVILRHRKLNELEIAHDCYELGDGLGIAETPFGRIGLMICADAFARGQVVSRSLALMGARVILSPCAWAVPPGHDNKREPYGKLWLDNYGPVARDFRMWIAGCSNVGAIKHGPWAGRRCIGCSLVVGPDGSPRVMGGYDVEEIISIDLVPQPAAARGPGWEKVWEETSKSNARR